MERIEDLIQKHLENLEDLEDEADVFIDRLIVESQLEKIIDLPRESMRKIVSELRDFLNEKIAPEAFIFGLKFTKEVDGKQ